MAGIINNTMQKMRGIQIAGIANYAKDVKGIQIALFNFSNTNSGLSIGLFNYVQKGYRQFEFIGNQTFHTGIKIRTGTRRFYNIYNFTATATDNLSYSYGLGFGTSLKIYKILYINLEVTENILFLDEWFNEIPYYYQSISPFFQLQFAKYFAVNIGLDFNNHIGINTNERYLQYISNLSHFNYSQSENNNIVKQYWSGFSIGISF